MHTRSGGKLLQKIIRSTRRLVKEALRCGEEPPLTWSTRYTD
ncbi:MAG TPA: hypothetical protein VHR66_32490 [Gemmataceae bacterium]|nr:hypothetical protein [Gemmataceae bacterium]